MGKRLMTQLGEVIGYTDIVFDNYDSTGRLVRKQETNTGNFAADALYYLFDNMGLDVDVAVMNGGGVRNSFSSCCNCKKLCHKETEPLLPLIKDEPVDTMNCDKPQPCLSSEPPSESTHNPLLVSLPAYINTNIDNTNLFKQEHYRQDEIDCHAFFVNIVIHIYITL